MLLKNKNRRIGFAYEYRFVAKRLMEGCTEVKRHYGSLGVTDVDWIDKNGQKHSAQLKFSTKKLPHLQQSDYTALQKYAITHNDTKIWLVCKHTRKPEIWELLS